MINARVLAHAARALSGPLDRRSLTDDEEHQIADLIEVLSEDDVEIVRPDDILGAKAVAELLDIEKSTLTRWRREGYLPKPYATPASGPIWLRPRVEAFKLEHEATADAAGRRPVGSRHAAAST